MWICHFCKEVFEIIYSRIRYRAITRKGVSNVAEVKPADDFTRIAGFLFLGNQDIYGKSRWVFSTVRPINLKRQVKKLRPIRGDGKKLTIV